MRMMRDKKNFALDTMSREELIMSAELCLKSNKGDRRYKKLTEKIVKDYQTNKNLYVTLKMRRVLMGFIRPVFEREWANRNSKTLQLTNNSIVST